MKGLTKKRRIQIIVLAFVAMAIATGLVGYAMKAGINFFRSPTPVAEEPRPPPPPPWRAGTMKWPISASRHGK